MDPRLGIHLHRRTNTSPSLPPASTSAGKKIEANKITAFRPLELNGKKISPGLADGAGLEVPRYRLN
jgi:hypothetical protein